MVAIPSAWKPYNNNNIETANDSEGIECLAR